MTSEFDNRIFQKMAEEYNKGAMRRRISTRMNPQNGDIYHDYSDFSSKEFLKEIAGLLEENREGAHEAFLKSPAKNEPVPKSEIAQHRAKWIRHGASGIRISPKELREADLVLSMLADFNETPEPDKKPEDYPDFQAIVRLEAKWEKSITGPLVIDQTNTGAKESLEFLSKWKQALYPNSLIK